MCGFLTAISCLMHSMVASSALVPRVASSSTAFTVFSREVTLVTITWKKKHVCFHQFRSINYQLIFGRIKLDINTRLILKCKSLKCFPHLGSALQLIHGRIICCLACCTLGGTNELSQSFGHIFHCINQNHLKREHIPTDPIPLWSEVKQKLGFL